MHSPERALPGGRGGCFLVAGGVRWQHACPGEVVLTPRDDKVIAYRDGVGRATVLGSAAATTPEQQFPVFHADMATLHLAVAG